jgi:putative hemolysin
MKITGLVFGSFSVGLLAFAVSVAQDTTPPPDTSGTQSSAQQAGTKPAGLPNPASVNCEKKGGKSDPQGKKVNRVQVSQWKRAEEWALGEMPPDDNTQAPAAIDQRQRRSKLAKMRMNPWSRSGRGRGLLLPANVGERLAQMNLPELPPWAGQLQPNPC